MKINKETLSNIILEELRRLDEKPSRQAKRQKKNQAKAKRREARKAKAASPTQDQPQSATKKAGQKAKEMGRAAKEAGQQAKAAAKPASPKQQGKPQKEMPAKRTPEEVKAKAEAEQKKRDAQEAKFQQAAFGDKEESGKAKQDKADPQAAAKAAAQQAKKTEKATTKAGLQAATGKKVDTGEQPEEIQKVSNEIQKLQKKLQSWAMKTAAKIPAEDKKARLAIMKIPMALKIASQSIDKISKQDNESLQAVLGDENPSEQPKEAAANRREVEEAVIYDLEELLKNEV